MRACGGERLLRRIVLHSRRGSSRGGRASRRESGVTTVRPSVRLSGTRGAASGLETRSTALRRRRAISLSSRVVACVRACVRRGLPSYCPRRCALITAHTLILPPALADPPALVSSSSQVGAAAAAAFEIRYVYDTNDTPRTALKAGGYSALIIYYYVSLRRNGGKTEQYRTVHTHTRKYIQ